jgi:hypothetical protein
MADVQPNRFYAVFKISEETNRYRGGVKFHSLKNFIEFGSLCAERKESEKADLRLHNKGALQSDPRGKHKTKICKWMLKPAVQKFESAGA